MKLIDRYGREVTSLRIDITRRCNLNCIYCHREGEITRSGLEISSETIKRIVKVAVSFGVRSVKFSGGEPLLRRDFPDIISDLPPLKEVSATTNGVFLERYAGDLADAGLNRVNVSLDSLKEEKYRFITGAREKILSKVIDGIHSAIDAGLTPVKLNMVLLRGINEDEIPDMMDFVRGKNLILQLIELMDFGGSGYHLDLSEIEKDLASRATSIRCRKMHRRKKYLVDGAEVEIVRPIDNSEFCANCTRLRVTSDGKLKTCLLRNNDLIEINDLSEEEMREAYKLAVMKRKPFYKKGGT
ncbi:MAG: GTP 3',8-cyclase MoaA [Candidatus Syntropharchaeia archaeon]